MIYDELVKLGEYAAAGMYEECERSLFYRKSLGLRRYYENCPLAPYEGKKLYPSGVLPTDTKICPYYAVGLVTNQNDFTENHPGLAECINNEFMNFKSYVPPMHRVAGDMYTHAMPNYERILSEGLMSYRHRIQKIQDEEIRLGLMHLTDGIICYINRCTEYLESMGADKELIQALKKVPLYPAENIYEALVSWNFVMYLDNCDNPGCLASGLMPYYNGEDVTDILENLYDNLDANNGYSMALGTDYSPLTLQCLEASKGKRRPMIELFADQTTPDEVWQKAFEVIRTFNGQPAFYNPHILLNGLMERIPSITKEDIKKFCGGGCTETMLAGLSCVGSLDAGINLPLIFTQTLNTSLCNCENFEKFYSCYIADIQRVLNDVTEGISKSRIERAKYNPLPMRTLLIDDCIDKGKDYYNGGARYGWSIINFAGIVNAIDSALAVKDLVYKKKYPKKDFIAMLKNNDSSLINECRNLQCSHGKDNDEVNSFAYKFTTDIFSMLDGKAPVMGEAFLPASIQFQSQVDAGKTVDATPDGRNTGEPLADSLGAIFGKDSMGPTSLIKSVTAMNLKKALGVPVLNLNVNPDFDNNTLKAMILTYMELGGVQLQLTCADTKTLKEAMEDPLSHKNLVVRVGGYSEYFHRLSPELRQMIVKRSIQSNI